MIVNHKFQLLLVSLRVDEDGGVEELAEAPKVHRYLVIESHEL